MKLLSFALINGAQSLGTRKLILLLGIFLAFGSILILSSETRQHNLVSSSTTNEISELFNTDQQSINSESEQSISETSSNNNIASINNNEISVDVNDNSNSSVSQTKSSVSIKIDSSSTTEPSSGAGNNNPSLLINGVEVELPKNGRLNETIEDETTRTRIRGNVDSDGSSSISISTNSN